MDKTYRKELQRYFLLNKFPQSVTRDDAHLQIFDNYLENTRMRLRKIRTPETNEWSWSIQQRLYVEDGLATVKVAEIHLNEEEYRTFERFEGREIRKNRYFFEIDDHKIELDSYLGRLWGLIMARVSFESVEKLREFELPFDAVEITRDRFFAGENLVTTTFSQTQTRVTELAGNVARRDLRERRTAEDAE